MAQKLVTVYQVESGKEGLNNLGERLTNIDNNVAINDSEIARINEAVMAIASAPITTPIFNDIETYKVVEAKAEVTSLNVTAGATSNGNITITLNGNPVSVSVSALDTTLAVANKIQSTIDPLNDYNATVSGSTVTITAVNKRSETDATFDGGSTGVTATITVTTQGVDGVDLSQDLTITIPNGKNYIVGKGNLLVLRNGISQVLADGDYTETSSTSIKYSANTLKDGDIITFIIGDPGKLNYNVSVSYYTSGADNGKIQTVSYTGDIQRSITYSYTSEGKIASEVIVEDNKTTTKTYTYTDGKITGISSVVS
jgi:hypothetical protein